MDTFSNHDTTINQKLKSRSPLNFPGGPMVKNPAARAGGHGFDPSAEKILYTAG